MGNWENTQLMFVAIINLLLIVVGGLLNFPNSVNVKQRVWFVVIALGLIACTYQYKSSVDQSNSGKKESAFIDDQTIKVSSLVASEEKLKKDLENLSNRVEKINSSIDEKISKFDKNLQKSESDIVAIMPFIKENLPLIGDRVVLSVNGIPSRTAASMRPLLRQMKKSFDEQTIKNTYLNHGGSSWSVTIPSSPVDTRYTAQDLGMQEPYKVDPSVKPNM